MTCELVDLPALRAFLVAHAVPGLDHVEVRADGSTRHRRLVRAGHEWCTLTVTLPVGAVGVPVVAAAEVADAVGVPVTAATVATAAVIGRRWLGLDVDPAPGVDALADDPVLGPLVRARPHLRVPGSTDGFETAVLVVLGQHVSLAAGRAFAARLVAAHGIDLGDLHAFPGPEVLAALDPAVVQRTLGITGARAHAVVATARAVVDGTLTLAPSTDVAQVRAGLLALPGVGPWTADLVALRALRDPDVFLPGDLVLRKALGGPSAQEAATMARAWRPHRSLAVLHLWTDHAIDPPRRP